MKLSGFRGDLPTVERSESAIPKSRAPYAPELRRRLVEMVRSGRHPAELTKEFEPSDQCIRNWVKQADLDDRMAPHSRTPSHYARDECAPRRPCGAADE